MTISCQLFLLKTTELLYAGIVKRTSLRVFLVDDIKGRFTIVHNSFAGSSHFFSILVHMMKSGAAMHFHFLLLMLLATLMMATVAKAQYRGGGDYRDGMYGQFCPGSRRGGPYGGRNPVATVDQARQAIEKCLATRGQGLYTGKIKENTLYFEVEVLDRNGAMVDEVIIHKRNGRVRSIYEPRGDTRSERGVLDAKE
jgi:hypothetical protein